MMFEAIQKLTALGYIVSFEPDGLTVMQGTWDGNTFIATHSATGIRNPTDEQALTYLRGMEAECNPAILTAVRAMQKKTR